MAKKLIIDDSKPTDELVKDLKLAYETLSDEKWDKNDFRAILTVFSALAGLGAAVFMMLERTGWL